MPRLVGHVSRLRTFPVKACKAVELDSAWCFYEGIEHDRRWAVVGDQSGACLDMVEHPSLCLIETRLQRDCLYLNAPGMKTLMINLPLPDSNQSRAISVGRQISTCGKGQSAGNEAAAWISRYLEIECSLYQLTESRVLTDHPKWGPFAKKGDKTGFCLFAPVLVVTTEALEDLNKSRQDDPFSMDRFRATIIVSGTTLHDEDNWKNLFIGEKFDVQLRFLRRCGRCPVTTVDPQTGIPTGQEPLKTLRKTRLPLLDDRKKEGYSPIFGVHFAVEKEGLLHVGDPVYDCSDMCNDS